MSYTTQTEVRSITTRLRLKCSGGDEEVAVVRYKLKAHTNTGVTTDPPSLGTCSFGGRVRRMDTDFCERLFYSAGLHSSSDGMDGTAAPGVALEQALAKSPRISSGGPAS